VCGELLRMDWLDFYWGTASSVETRDGVMKEQQGRSAVMPFYQQQKLNGNKDREL